jgi:5-methylcytosine-specific restriction endonuclease McrA
MARIRTIKPEFFTSEDIVALSPLARLLYVGLWCEADKEGRLEWKPITFKMRYLPADECDIRALCAELVSRNVVRLYGEGLAYIPGFSRHQHVNPRESESTLPAPDGVKAAGPRKVGKTLREAVFERDGHRCVRCSSEDKLECDHILPQTCGGPHIIENLRTLCKKCNAGRPVQGKALDEDLAKDGHTLESLRVKFGIDASISKRHAQGGREGKGKEGDSRVVDDDPDTHGAPPPVVLMPLIDGSEFPISSMQVAEWSAAFPAVDVPQKLAAMRSWCNANPSRRKTRRGVETFIVQWLGKDQDSGRGRTSQQVDLMVGAV